MANKYSAADAIRRRETILQVVRQRPVYSQEELLELIGESGFHVTQPTLSRDLRELGLVKTPSGYVAPAPGGETAVLAFVPKDTREHRLDQAIAEFARSIERAGNLIVMKTPPAAAQPLSRALDEAQLPGVLGCIGGDDTVFVAVSSVSAARKLTSRFHESLIPSRPSRGARA